jgi:hypothetical protein
VKKGVADDDDDDDEWEPVKPITSQCEVFRGTEGLAIKSQYK